MRYTSKKVISIKILKYLCTYTPAYSVNFFFSHLVVVVVVAVVVVGGGGVGDGSSRTKISIGEAHLAQFVHLRLINNMSPSSTHDVCCMKKKLKMGIIKSGIVWLYEYIRI